MYDKYIFRSHSTSLYSNAQITKTVLACPAMQWLFPIEFWGSDLKRYTYLTPEAIDVDLMSYQMVKYLDPYAPITKGLSFYSPQTKIWFNFSLKLEKSPTLTSNLMIELPKAAVLSGQIADHQIKQMMVELVPAFQVEMSQIYDSHAERYKQEFIKIGEHYQTSKFIGWIAYFGGHIVDYMGRERFERLLSCYRNQELQNGILLTLQEEPMNWDNLAHRECEEQVMAELGLEDFLYKRELKHPNKSPQE